MYLQIPSLVVSQFSSFEMMASLQIWNSKHLKSQHLWHRPQVHCPFLFFHQINSIILRLIKSIKTRSTYRKMCVVFWPMKILKVVREKQYWALCSVHLGWGSVLYEKRLTIQEAPFSVIRWTEGSPSLCMFLIVSLWINLNCLCKQMKSGTMIEYG